LPVRGGRIAEFLAEREVGAYASRTGIVKVAARFDAVLVSVAIVAIGTNEDDLIRVGIIASL